jgi:hypothetical protein
MDAQWSVVMKTPKNLGMVLLAIWLIVYGVLNFVSFSHSGLVLAVLGIAAGILILMQR